MNAVIIILLVIVCAAALFFTLRRFRKGGGCCGEHENAAKRIRAGRIAPEQQTRHVSIAVGGMTCENCARKVQNALNSLPGVRAKVSISSKSAEIDCADAVTDDALRDAVRKAGYIPMS